MKVVIRFLLGTRKNFEKFSLKVHFLSTSKTKLSHSSASLSRAELVEIKNSSAGKLWCLLLRFTSFSRFCDWSWRKGSGAFGAIEELSIDPNFLWNFPLPRLFSLLKASSKHNLISFLSIASRFSHFHFSVFHCQNCVCGKQKATLVCGTSNGIISWLRSLLAFYDSHSDLWPRALAMPVEWTQKWKLHEYGMTYALILRSLSEDGE